MASFVSLWVTGTLSSGTSSNSGSKEASERASVSMGIEFASTSVGSFAREGFTASA